MNKLFPDTENFQKKKKDKKDAIIYIVGHYSFENWFTNVKNTLILYLESNKVI